KEQLAKRAETHLELRFDSSEEVQKRAYQIFKSKSGELGALGYSTPDSSLKRLFEHLSSQNHTRSLDAKTLQEIVLFTLVYGCRKGEVIGVAHRVKGKTIHLGGLR